MVQCYYKNDDNPNMIRSINSGVCMGSGSAAGVHSCCFPWDECLPNSMCHSTDSLKYYTALCTDQTLQDPVCQHGCDGLYRTGVTYNATTNLWACCDDNSYECSTSTNSTFEAPAPQSLLAQTMAIVDFIPSSTAPVSSSGTSTSVSSAASSNVSATSATSTTISSSGSPTSPGTPTSAPTSTDAADTQQTSTISLSTGAKAGISVAVVVIVLAAIAGLVFWLLRRRKRRNVQVTKAPIYGGELPATANVLEKDASRSSAYETDGAPRTPVQRSGPHEMYS